MLPSAMSELIEITESGLYCPAGDFHIDPWRPVARALVTHAHADHARPGCGAYLAAADGVGILRRRLGRDATIEPIAYASARTIGRARVSFHPAGHVLGSAQIRVERGGDSWVLGGDYKTAPDPTCRPFEPVPCRTFVTESTFGLPVYRWRPTASIFRELHEWWRANREEGRTSLVFAYAFGKAQRVLAGLDPGEGPVLVHGAVDNLIAPYREAGVRLPPTRRADADAAKETRGRALVVAPPSAAGSTWIRKFGDVSTAFVSGWMQIRGSRRRRNVDRGFAVSDHADWDGLHAAIDATGAERVGVTHGYAATLARHLREQGRDAFVLPTRFEGETLEETTDRDADADADADTETADSGSTGGGPDRAGDTSTESEATR